VDDFIGENVINLVTIESKGVIGSKFNVAAFVFFRIPKSLLLIATSPCAQFYRSSTEIKISHVKPETVKPDIADGIYVKF